MSTFANEKRRITWLLCQPDTAASAMRALGRPLEKAEAETLVELIHEPPSGWLAAEAIRALDGWDGPLVLDALQVGLESGHVGVRVAALELLQRRGARDAQRQAERLLREDPSWLVRRAAVRVVGARPGPGRWAVLSAATDPHWRPRHALIQVLLEWGAAPALRREIEERLTSAGGTPRVQGVLWYLRYRWGAASPKELPELDGGEDHHQRPWWSWDDAVLARNVKEMAQGSCPEDMDYLLCLLGHPEERVHRQVVRLVRQHADGLLLARALRHLEEPRTGGAERVHALVEGLDLDRIEEAARHLLHQGEALPAQLAWALRQVDSAFPMCEESARLQTLLNEADHFPPGVRAALARLPWEEAESVERFLADPDPEVRQAALEGVRRRQSGLEQPRLAEQLAFPDPLVRAEAVRLTAGEVGEHLQALAEDPDFRVRLALAEVLAPRGEGVILETLRRDAHPHVRAAALDEEAARRLLLNPGEETSWHVLGRAARLARKPLWQLAPQIEPGRRTADEETVLNVGPGTPPHWTSLGPGLERVSRLGVSGHYGLPVEGLVRALEEGINVFFWEPNYHTMNQLMRRLGRQDRGAIHYLAGTFEADGEGVRRDVERALRMLRVERIALFLIFWVRSWERITQEMLWTLEQLQREGKLGLFTLSTHVRSLAVEALGRGWGPLMVRHSAAHRKAEQEVFPLARERGVPVITFSSTCYGRLLRPGRGLEPPSATDCLRYCLEQPGVSMTLTAPATEAQLEENLDALRDPTLPEERRQHLLRCGAVVYEEDTVFRKLVRQL